MPVYGYCRCSTDESRQDIDRQRRELRKLGVSDENIYFEYASGIKIDRVEWERLLSVVKEGDTIATTEVSRLTRSTKQLCDIIEMAKTKRIKLVIGGFAVDFRSDTPDPMTEGMLLMWGVFAEMERNIISQRVKSGMANAKSKGRQIGRPKTDLDSLPNSFIRHYPKYKQGDLTVTDLSRLCSVSRQSIYKYIKIYEEVNVL